MTRCCANAAGRRSAGVSAESSVPWLGQNAPLPVPASAFSRKACQAEVMSGKSANAHAMISSAATSVVRAPMRSASEPAIGPETSAAAPFVAAINPARPRRYPPHVVEVDDEERHDDAVSEHVREAACLEQPDRAGELRIQAADIAGERAHGAQATHTVFRWTLPPADAYRDCACRGL